MKVLSYTEARANLARTMDSVVDDAEEAVITRAGHEPVVMVSMSTWRSVQETDYLLSNPAMAEFLRRNIAELDKGHGIERELIDPDAISDVA